MAELVGGFLVPHVPLITANPTTPPLEKRKTVMDAFATVNRRLNELKVDTVVIIGDDHYTIFGPQCVPRCLIGIGTVEGPVEPWVNIPRRPVQNDTGLAEHIMQTGFDNDVDWAVSKTLTLDHSVMLPYHLAVSPSSHMKIVPIYQSCAVEPLISSRRIRKIGAITGDAIRSYPSNTRVAILGTGGLSHWVGMARMGDVNEEWDQKVIELVRKGDIDALIAREEMATIEAAGNGALEIKNWIFAMAALGKTQPELIAYAPVPEWVTGCAFMELKVA
ncbi:MAG: protocatechuate 3,4-dioxygenase [Steroidobacteraceae bacterium]